MKTSNLRPVRPSLRDAAGTCNRGSARHRKRTWEGTLSLIRPVAMAIAIGFGALALVPGGPVAWAESNFFEQRKIEAQALEAFQRVLRLWQEEVYFELYDFGMAESRARISREQFAQRMVELSWVPKGELNPKHLKTSFRFRTLVYITARVPYQHKFNPDRRFSKDQTMMLVQEEGQWRLDLIELIRSPYSGV